MIVAMSLNTEFNELPRFIPPRMILVAKSAGFKTVGVWVVNNSPIATATLQALYKIELDFFLSLDSGLCILWMTDMLSPKAYVGPEIGMPIVLNLYGRPRPVSIAFFNDTHSAPKTDDSTVDCALQCQTINALCRYTWKPVLDLLVAWSPAWSESTDKWISTSFPCEIGALSGIASCTSPYNYFQSHSLNWCMSLSG